MEKNADAPDYFELGREEAMLWLKEAESDEILAVLEWDPSSTQFPKLDDFNEYLNVVMRDAYPELNLNQEDYRYWPFNDNNERFWEGWKDQVAEFWKQTKDKV